MTTRKDGWQGMNWIRQEKRLAIYIRDNFTCQHCGRDLKAITKADGIRIELDHLTPASCGGSNEATNLVTSCSRCNACRQAKSLEEFHQSIERAYEIAAQALQPINIRLAKQVLVERKGGK